MIPRELVNKLTKTELAMLLWILNKLFPTGLEITPALVSSYKAKYLVRNVSMAANLVKDDKYSIYVSLCKKLHIPVRERLANG